MIQNFFKTIIDNSKSETIITDKNPQFQNLQVHLIYLVKFFLK
jgi:hypothetical protein